VSTRVSAGRVEGVMDASSRKTFSRITPIGRSILPEKLSKPEFLRVSAALPSLKRVIQIACPRGLCGA